MVVIIDPHLKRTSDYPVYQKASELGILVKPKSGEGEYEGWCWSGSSSWVDFFNPGSWDYWKSLFKIKKHKGQWSWTESTESVFVWNDMNEVRRNECLRLMRVEHFATAVCVQWPRDNNAKGQHSLRRMGTP